MEEAAAIRKIRTRQHVIADLSVNHVERQALLCGFSVERLIHDYGIDLLFFTYDDLGQIEQGAVFIQVKTTDHIIHNRARTDIAFRVSYSDLQLWLR